jgi:hypothetical protein
MRIIRPINNQVQFCARTRLRRQIGVSFTETSFACIAKSDVTISQSLTKPPRIPTGLNQKSIHSSIPESWNPPTYFLFKFATRVRDVRHLAAILRASAHLPSDISCRNIKFSEAYVSSPDFPPKEAFNRSRRLKNIPQKAWFHIIRANGETPIFRQGISS